MTFMKFEKEPQSNPIENPESQKLESPDEKLETNITSALQENMDVSETDIIAHKEADAKKIAELRKQLGLQSETVQENLEQKKERLDSFWANWEKIQDDPELIALFDRKQKFNSQREVSEILREHNYPGRTKISELQLEKWKASLNPKFIKDGFIYLLRGDYPDLDKKGFYARTYGYGKLTTKQLVEELHTSNEVGYILYGDERFLTKAKPSSDNKAEELALAQSKRGGSSFISTTTSIPCAEAGTGNVPDAAEQLEYETYILKVPLDSAMNSNTGNFYGMEEDEILVPDYVSKEEIIAKFPHGKTEEVYQYLHNLLGVTKEDLKMQEK